jgi:outer membrane lipase/esterase
MLEFLRARRRALVVAVASAATVFLVSCSGDNGDTPPLFQTMVTFGPSTSDNGNACNLNPTSCPPSPPYASGRYSNGPLWIDTVAARYGASARPSRTGGTNFAYAGARTGTVPGVTTPPSVPSMVVQVEQHLASVGYAASPSTLYVVDATTAGNNIIDALTLSASNPQAPAQVLTAAVTDVASTLLRLYSAGARHIAVLNLANVGKAPGVVPLGAAASAGATQMAAQFNGALAQQIAGLKATSPGLNIYVADLFAAHNQWLANPAAVGLSNATDACFKTTPAPTVCANPAQYLWWDGLHATQAGGSLIANLMISAIGR